MSQPGKRRTWKTQRPVLIHVLAAALLLPLNAISTAANCDVRGVYDDGHGGVVRLLQHRHAIIAVSSVFTLRQWSPARGKVIQAAAGCAVELFGLRGSFITEGEKRIVFASGAEQVTWTRRRQEDRQQVRWKQADDGTDIVVTGLEVGSQYIISWDLPTEQHSRRCQQQVQMHNTLVSSCPMQLATGGLAAVLTSYAAKERIKIAAIGTKAKPLVGVSITRTAQRLDFTGCIGAGRMEPGWALAMRQQPQETDGLLEPENEQPLLSCCQYCAGLRHHFCALSAHSAASYTERAGFTCACGRTTPMTIAADLNSECRPCPRSETFLCGGRSVSEGHSIAAASLSFACYRLRQHQGERDRAGRGEGEREREREGGQRGRGEEGQGGGEGREGGRGGEGDREPGTTDIHVWRKAQALEAAAVTPLATALVTGQVSSNSCSQIARERET